MDLSLCKLSAGVWPLAQEAVRGMPQVRSLQARSLSLQELARWQAPKEEQL